MLRLGGGENFPPSTYTEEEVDVFFDRVCKLYKLCKLRNEKSYLCTKSDMFFDRLIWKISTQI